MLAKGKVAARRIKTLARDRTLAKAKAVAGLTARNNVDESLGMLRSREEWRYV